MKNKFDECLLRLKENLGVMSNKDVAELLGLSEKAFSARRTRDVFPEEKLWVLAQKRPDLKIDVLAVTTGLSAKGQKMRALDDRAVALVPKNVNDFKGTRGSILRSRKALEQAESAADESNKKLIEQAASYIFVPQYDVAASAGGGSIISDESVVDHLAFKREWITQSLGCQPDKICVIQVRGDSMTPTINDADLLLLDMREISQRTEGVYVIQLDGSLLVKRISYKINGSVEVISDNARYGTQTLTESQGKDLAFIGRVVWHGRKF